MRRISFNLAPPMLADQRPAGRPRKRQYPAWALLPPFRLLKRLKGLRVTILVPFDHTAERKTERALARDYEALVDCVAARLDVRDIDAVAELLALAGDVRGFGPVKRAAMDTYGPRAADLEAALVRARYDEPVCALS